MTDDVISANPNAPLDLAPFRKPEVPPAVAPLLRRGLMDIGARFSLVMAASGEMPETIAQKTGLSLALINQIRDGSEPDASIRTLTIISAALGLNFQFSVPLPAAPPPASHPG